MAKKEFIIFIVPFILIFSLNCMNGDKQKTLKEINPDHLPYKIIGVNEIILELSHKYLWEDMDGDGKSERYKFWRDLPYQKTPQNHITISNFAGTESINQLDFEGEIHTTFFDIHGDNFKELIVSEYKDDSVFVHIYNKDGNPNKKSLFIATGHPRGTYEWECFVTPLQLADLNDDLKSDILLHVNTTYALKPRGLYAFDWENEKIHWRHHLAPSPMYTLLEDINNDKQVEILVGTNAPYNGDGEEINNTDDQFSYFLILDRFGNRIMLKQIGDMRSELKLFSHDLDKDGQKEIYGISKNPNELSNDKSVIYNFDRKNQILLSVLSDSSIINSLLFFTDVTNDGYDEIITFWENGTIRILDSDYNNLKIINLGEDINVKPMSFDVTGDNINEFLIGTASNLYVFDKNFELLAKYSGIVKSIQQIQTGYKDSESIVVEGLNKNTLLKLKRNRWGIFKPILPWIGGAIMGLLLMGGLNARKFRKDRNRILFNKQYLNNSLQGILVLDKNRNIETINEVAKDILQLKGKIIDHKFYKSVLDETKYLPLIDLIETSYKDKLIDYKHEISLKIDDSPKELLLTITKLNDNKPKNCGIVITFTNLTEIVKSKRTIAWATMAKKLAHEIKTPLSTVRLAAQRLQMDYKKENNKKALKYDKYVNYIVDEVHHLHGITNGFMKFASLEKLNLKRTNINQLINQSLEKFVIRFSSGIELKPELSKNLPDANLDEDQMMIALHNIFDNSLNAMKGQGVLTISTNIISDPVLFFGNDHILIEVSDTGTGISEENLQNIYQPLFTNSEGGVGLGLTIVKKIIEDHHGKIKIQSKIKIGTTVLIYLPIF